MGLFTKSVITPSRSHAGRAIYENSNGKHLYFWKPAGNWIIESDGNFQNSYGVVYAHSDVKCPESAGPWKIWDGSTWSLEYSISVVENQTAVGGGSDGDGFGNEFARDYTDMEL